MLHFLRLSNFSFSFTALFFSIGAFAQDSLRVSIEDFSDKIGHGVLIHSSLKGDILLDEDYCAFRDVLDRQNQQIVEFDFLGGDNFVPAAFEVARAEVDMSKQVYSYALESNTPARLFSMNEQKYQWEDFFKNTICMGKGKAQNAEVVMHLESNQITISWNVECLTSSVSEPMALKLTCSL